MALLDDIKICLRVTNNALDAEVNMLIDSARADLVRAGIRDELVNPSSDSDIEPMVKQAITCYCKAHFGYDNTEANRLRLSYEDTLNRLMNSPANIATGEVDSE